MAEELRRPICQIGKYAGSLTLWELGPYARLHMFKETLRQIVDGTDGAIAGLLMGFDGIAVESYTRDEATGGKDITEIGMEFSVILGSIRRAAETLEAGGAKEVAIQAEHLTTLIRVVNDDYFIALTMRPDGNPGKGRFVLRTAAPRLMQELS